MGIYYRDLSLYNDGSCLNSLHVAVSIAGPILGVREADEAALERDRGVADLLSLSPLPTRCTGRLATAETFTQTPTF